MSAFSQNSCLSGLGFEDSLVQSQEELWCSQNLHLSACLNFILWVSFLAGVLNWNRCAEFHSLLLLERCEIHIKRNKNLCTLGNFDVLR